MARRRRSLSGRAIRAAVEARARNRCEYCHAPQLVCGYRFHLEHIVPSSRGGSDGIDNRALACSSCNLAKANRVASLDPTTGTTASFFNPRSEVWDEHFRWSDDRATLEGLTPTGRATAAALDMNSDLRRQARRFWFQVGLLP